MEMAPSQGNGAPAPFPSLVYDSRICILLQSTHEVAVVLIDQREPTVAVEPEIEQKQPSTQPVPGVELAAFVDSFVGEIALCERPLGDVVDEVQLRSRLILLSRWKLAEEPMQPKNVCIGDHCVAELGELR